MSFNCPKCHADQQEHWFTPDPKEMEGRDWHCPKCRAYLMLLLGQVTIVHVPPPQGHGGSALPPGSERR